MKTDAANDGSAHAPSPPLTQLLTVLATEPVFTFGRCLFVGSEPLQPQNVLAATVATPSQDRYLLAVATLQKQVTIFDRIDRHWQSRCTHTLPKRITALAIDDAATHVVVSDAVGDVYRLPLDQHLNLKHDDVQQRCLLLGHFSTITDISLTSSFIATADRDNKIRVSRYPSSYVIEAFCLSHTQFVTTLQWTLLSNVLLSAAGDGTIRLWDGANGKLLDCLQLSEARVMQQALGADVQPLVVKFAVHPLNKDVAFFALHRCNAIFAVFGLQQAKLKRLALACSFGAERFVTGLCTSSEGFAYVSVRGESCVLRAAVSSSTDAASGVLTFAALKSSRASCGSDGGTLSEREENDVVRFNWLARQRKKDMVHNWKGKKRRHVDM
eukprot:TRINITY_DN716_c0_g1_i2.p2 TRINITY_DN716_c0_g1~~TRINITY_DN716_c0_g1_i2.p2  ORF type:complete len:383 (-),score=63.60 TRINITY_DN716_c0_g1_i2:2053-3201(-)